MSDRTIVYKRCKFHARHKDADPAQLERECRGCRKAGFLATMRARGVSVTVPTYKGGWGLGFGPGWKSIPGDKPGMRAPGVFAVPLAELFVSRQLASAHPKACDCLECITNRITADLQAKRAS